MVLDTHKRVCVNDVAHYYDRRAQQYDTLYQDPVSAYENRVVRDILRKFPIESSVVYDGGCGTGLFLDMGFRPLHYVGVDISKSMIQRAARKRCEYWASFLQQDLMDIRNDVCDGYVSLFGSLGYTGCLNIKRLLQPLRAGGWFVIMLYAAQSARIEIRIDRSGHEGLPVAKFSRSDIERQLIGWDVEVRSLNRCLKLGTPKWFQWWLNAAGEQLDPDRCQYHVVYGLKAERHDGDVD